MSINKYNGERVIILDYKEAPLEQILIKYLIIGEKQNIISPNQYIRIE